MATHTVNTHEAKSRLSELIREVEAGADVIVARNGRPVAKLIPWPPSHAARVPGAWAGQVSVSGDIIGTDDQVAEMFDESAEGDL